jgi:hypothetical protein
MRAAFLALLAVFLVHPTFALPISDGKIVSGKYTARGKVSISGVTVTYLPSNVRLTNHGKVKGFISRIVTSRDGAVLESGYVRIRGNCRSMFIKRGAFTARATLHIADGAAIRGDFHGLIDPSQKLSRYFKGKITGSGGSRFKLQAR